MYTRREFGKIALGSVPLVSVALPLLSAAGVEGHVATDASKFNGVQIGVQTYSYRSLRDLSQPFSVDYQKKLVDTIINAMVQDQINSAEFWIGYIEPPSNVSRTAPAGTSAQDSRERVREWRTSHPREILHYARDQFSGAGIDIHSCMYNFDDAITDPEIDAAFEMADALGTKIISANCTVASIKRVAPFADKHKTLVAAHSENAPFDPNVDGMVFGDNLLAAQQLSPYMRITLDIGHFWAYGGDPVKFIRENHDRIVNLHLKDRLKNHPEFHSDTNDLAFGKADTPIIQVLELMRDEKYTFPATIEFEYKTDKSCIEAVRDCVDYCKAALA